MGKAPRNRGRKPTIVIVDDHDVVREGVRAVLMASGHYQVVAEADGGEAAVAKARECAPDLVVIDCSMPDMNGDDATRRILAARPETRVIALSVCDNVERIRRMFRAGARGCVCKDVMKHQLVDAVKAVLDGSVYLSPTVGDVMITDILAAEPGSALRIRPEDQAVLDRLSVRERTILRLLADGAPIKHVADELGLALKTAEKARRDLMLKLGTDNLPTATKFAVRTGLATLQRRVSAP